MIVVFVCDSAVSHRKEIPVLWTEWFTTKAILDRLRRRVNDTIFKLAMLKSPTAD